ncbi:hypothetical protein [Actinoplanes palleronii]|uniref:DUF2975 domain-containing protein n=1 Tax=Actinoplanes palleronii TaxID=113570 RepID=A0ABQ4B986_9ACTN|nr:hypothetical protein [Actinoplanes palleronii]GIE67220.1 hypothetical protein Apa02nite_033280 [Actinoplanes palleronii]
MAPSSRRSGALRPLRALLTVTVVANVGFLVIAAIDWIMGTWNRSEFWAPADALTTPVIDPLLPAFTVQADNVAVVVTVADQTPAQAVLDVIAGGTPGAIAWLVIAVLARRIVTAALGPGVDPFAAATAGRIRRLGIVILTAGGLAELISAAAEYTLYRSVFKDSSFTGAGAATFSLWWLPLGLAVLAFAAVVRHGSALRAELDEVI